ncbi:uncharacterized protein LOC128355481 [Scomber scombrus]|uniref:E3 ubiquitin-protein ligase n=1 Tax=Scomber scombrus TaxID=13677 RepID=A0AAV1N864_SCOSC
MSLNDQSEPMEVDPPNNNSQPSQSADNKPAEEPVNSDIQQTQSADIKPAEASKLSSQNEELLSLKFKWLEPENPHKSKYTLEKLLQSWFNKQKLETDCSVIDAQGDGTAQIKIDPVPVLTALQKLTGETLSSKDGRVKILSFTLGSPNPPEDASVVILPSSVSEPLQDEQEQVRGQSSSAAVPTAGEDTRTCSVPVSHFWYVNHIYQEEIKRIEKESGVKITADVKVTFEAVQKDGSPDTASSEFTNLVQKSLGESEGSVIPLEYTDPEEWRDTLKIIQKKENKLLLTLNSEKMIMCGPRQSQDLIKKTLNTSQKTLTNANMSVVDSTWATQDITQTIDMTIKDPLADSGLTMEESYWKLLTTSFSGVLANIKAKFGVTFKDSDIGQGKVIVKACHKSGGNASMESHAVRALLNQYQKCATSPMRFTQNYSGSALNGAATEEGATAGDNEDENCPICLDTFTNKKQLKCKHEFCDNCLSHSMATMGPICPLCKDVFGQIQGDQPDGKMTWKTHSYSLPGFQTCGTIVIDYDIQSGKQTARHPNPGEWYSGIRREAYLPDNKEGKEVLRLLKRAFDQKLIFTIGTSRTTGLDNQVTWNDIHHKTSKTGGQQGFGYPDPDYLSRVREELKAKGIE